MTTTTAELLAFVAGRKNVDVTMVVVEVGETRVFAPKVDGKPPSKKTEVRLINDEEEQLKLCVWGDQGHEVRKQLVVGGLLDAKAVFNQRYRFGDLPVEMQFRPESTIVRLRSVYKIRGLQLMDADQIDPATAWRIRCRGVVVKEFARYYQGDTGLSGDIIVGRNLRMQVVLHSVPATYSNSFRVGTDVELKGHVTSKGGLVELEVQWEGVCNVNDLTQSRWSIENSVRPTGDLDDTKLSTSSSSSALFANSSARYSSEERLLSLGNANFYSHEEPRRSCGLPTTPMSINRATGSQFSFGNANTSTPKTSKPFGLDLPGEFDFSATLIKPFVFDERYDLYVGSVMVFGRGHPMPLKVQARFFPAKYNTVLGPGSKVYVKGHVYLEGRTLVMDANERNSVAPCGLGATKERDFSQASDISGRDGRVHRLRAKIIGGFAMTEDSSAYVGTVIVEDEELVSIVLTIRSVPDDKAHKLCESAELDVTGRVTGDDFEMLMECDWQSVVVLQQDLGESVKASDKLRSSPLLRHYLLDSPSHSTHNSQRHRSSLGSDSTGDQRGHGDHDLHSGDKNLESSFDAENQSSVVDDAGSSSHGISNGHQGHDDELQYLGNVNSSRGTATVDGMHRVIKQEPLEDLSKVPKTHLSAADLNKGVLGKVKRAHVGLAAGREPRSSKKTRARSPGAQQLGLETKEGETHEHP